MQCPLTNQGRYTITFRLGEIWSRRSSQSQISVPPRGPITRGPSASDLTRILGLSDGLGDFSDSASWCPFPRCERRVVLHDFLLAAQRYHRREAISVPYRLVVRISVDCILADQVCRCLPVVSQQSPFGAVGA